MLAAQPSLFDSTRAPQESAHTLGLTAMFRTDPRRHDRIALKPRLSALRPAFVIVCSRATCLPRDTRADGRESCRRRYQRRSHDDAAVPAAPDDVDLRNQRAQSLPMFFVDAARGWSPRDVRLSRGRGCSSQNPFPLGEIAICESHSLLWCQPIRMTFRSDATHVLRNSQMKEPRSGKDSKQPRQPVSLKQLAEHLGLNPATVSVVLNDVPGRSIPQATRDRIKAAAKKMNYHPSLLARSLRNRRTLTIGILLPELGEGYHSQVMSGIGDQLISAGYFYFTAHHRHQKSLVEEYTRMFIGRGHRASSPLTLFWSILSPFPWSRSQVIGTSRASRTWCSITCAPPSLCSRTSIRSVTGRSHLCADSRSVPIPMSAGRA